MLTLRPKRWVPVGHSRTWCTGVSVPSPQFGCEPKAALKNQSLTFLKMTLFLFYRFYSFISLSTLNILIVLLFLYRSIVSLSSLGNSIFVGGFVCVGLPQMRHSLL